MDNLTLDILGLFACSPAQALTIHKISKLLKRTYPFVHKKVNRLVEEGILQRKIVGRAHEVLPNLKKEKTRLLFALNAQQQKEKYLEKSAIRHILIEGVTKLRSNDHIQAMVLFGSYAKARETKKSDIDLLIIVDAKTREIDEYILSIINTLNMTFGCQINALVIDNLMFKEMLASKEELNVGKEALKSHILLYGFEHFWASVGEGLWH